jgi:hypothetical protein
MICGSGGSTLRAMASHLALAMGRTFDVSNPFSIFVEKIEQSNNNKIKKVYFPANSDFEV